MLYEFEVRKQFPQEQECRVVKFHDAGEVLSYRWNIQLKKYIFKEFVKAEKK